MSYTFGVFEFDQRTAVLTRSDRPVALEPQPARALALLLSRAGDVVRRDELIAHLWGGDTHVDFDRGLAYCIGQLRAALGDSADNPRFIQTLPRRGFSFIAPMAGYPLPAPVANPLPATVSAPAAHPMHTRHPSAAHPMQTRHPSGRHLRGSSVNAEDAKDVQSGTTNAERQTENAERPPSVASRSVPAALLLATVAVVLLIVTAAGAWRAWRPDVPERPIVAVAAFDSETGDASRERAVSTIADVIVERLTALGPSRIGVNGNSKVLHNPRADRDPRTVARETHASFLVAGHLQTKDGRLSLLMHIIRLDDGTHVWVQRISRSPDDRLETLDEDVAAQIEKAVRRIVLKDGAQVS